MSFLAFNNALARSDAGLPLGDDEREMVLLYGAAYKVCFERLNPDGCGEAEWPATQAAAVRIREWARGEEASLDERHRAAYDRAVADVLRRAHDRLENMRRGNRMLELYDQIPKPPTS